ncbi:MAG: hypothetical protein O7H39_03805 [Gammaproteobacteria bacterium]|nr:hypothetical protein [Gammaproteobacteria bacterium]
MPRPMITQHVPPRSLAMLLAVAFALTGLAGHLYVLKKPMGYLAEARDTFFDLRRSHPSDQPIEARIRSVEASTAALREKLQGAGPSLAANEMVAFVIGRLDRLAQSRRVQLISVEPGDIAEVFEFDEIPFHVEVVGGYFRLVAWLHDAERDLGPMVVKSFDIEPVAPGDTRRMRLTMVSYRPRSGGA